MNSSDPLRGGLGFKPVGVTVGEARQRNDTIFDRDSNVIGIKIGIPFQLVPDIAFNFTVGFHDWLLVCTKGICGSGGRRYRSRQLMAGEAPSHDDRQLPLQVLSLVVKEPRRDS